MKSAVLFNYGESPKFQEYPEPSPKKGEILVDMVASSIKQLDKTIASGRHYTKYPSLPAIVGLDGIAQLADGAHVYIPGIHGALAQKAIATDGRWIVVPANLNIELAAALPNALIGADAALLYRGAMKSGDHVMVNGATGATGRIAVQMAKNRGAGCVIAMGRQSSGLSELKDLGADILIDTEKSEELLVEELKAITAQYQPSIIIDYLWGHPVELILQAFKSLPPRKLVITTVGEMAGSNIILPSAILRSTQIEFTGSGIGSIPYSDIHKYVAEVLPEVFQLAAEGKIKIDLEITQLKDVETIWSQNEKPGSRIVIKI